MGIKVLFLDLDGVVNSVEGETLHQNIIFNDQIDGNSFRSDLVDNVRTLCHLFDLKIVITSTWRMDYTLPEMRVIFNKQFSNDKNHIKFDIIDFTTKCRIGAGDNDRAFQINQWLLDKKYDVDDYLILDDENVKGYGIDENKLIKVSGERGFTTQDLDLAILKHFHKEDLRKSIDDKKFFSIKDKNNVLSHSYRLKQFAISADNSRLYELLIYKPGSDGSTSERLYSTSIDLLAEIAYTKIREICGYSINYSYSREYISYKVDNKVYTFDHLYEMYISLSEELIKGLEVTK